LAYDWPGLDINNLWFFDEKEHEARRNGKTDIFQNSAHLATLATQQPGPDTAKLKALVIFALPQ
jgi:hypothetical protein